MWVWEVWKRKAGKVDSVSKLEDIMSMSMYFVGDSAQQGKGRMFLSQGREEQGEGEGLDVEFERVLHFYTDGENCKVYLPGY